MILFAAAKVINVLTSFEAAVPTSVQQGAV